MHQTPKNALQQLWVMAAGLLINTSVAVASSVPTMTADPSTICSDLQFYDSAGDLVTGTKSCVSAATPDCAVDGETGCLTSAAYPAVDKSHAAAEAILAGVAIGGTSGTLNSGVVLCTEDGATACTTTAAYPAADKTLAVATTFTPGTTVLGTSGSGGSPCTSDGQQGCVSNAAFTAANPRSISTWDLRAGKSLAGVNGSLKLNCRNGANSSVFNYDGPITGLPNGAELYPGTAIDFWDTVSDFGKIAVQRVTGWSDATACGSELWTDVTTSDGGITTTNCFLSPANCQHQDQVSKLVVAPVISTSDDWAAAVLACQASTVGGFPGGTWRLPTLKEFMSLTEHGYVAVSADPQTNYYFWTGTSSSATQASAWVGGIGQNAFYGSFAKSTAATFSSLCVR